MKARRRWMTALSVVLSVLPLLGTEAAFAQSSNRLRLVEAAESQVGRTVRYDPAYTSLQYPAGDVPIERGVCTDVVIRAFRTQGVDFQVLVHNDVKANFSKYPTRWGLQRPDKNIDHRRVLNLATFLRRKGHAVTVSGNAADYEPGDIVSWDLVGNGSLPHIGIVSNRRSTDGDRPLIVHNIGEGTKVEDILFSYKVTGHFRWFKA